MCKYISIIILILSIHSFIIAEDNECFPSCRSGYICFQGRCIEKCNPPCSVGEICDNMGECIDTMYSINDSSMRIQRELFHSKKVRFWGNSGFGPSTVKYANGGNLSVEYKRLLLSFFTDYNWEWTIFEQREQVNAVGITAGTTFYRKLITMSIAAGPGFVWGEKLGKEIPDSGGWFSSTQYEEIDFRTGGISLYGNIIFTPLPFLGIGIQTWGNWNVDFPYAGCMGCLFVGKLRK